MGSPNRQRYMDENCSWEIPDPGTGAALPVSKTGMINFVTGASGETNTLAAPARAGLVLDLVLLTDGGGDRVVTVSAGINSSANTIITFNDAGDHVQLKSIKFGATFVWRVIVNNGATLS